MSYHYHRPEPPVPVLLLLIFGILAVLLSACSHSQMGTDPFMAAQQDGSRMEVWVENHNWRARNVHILCDGARRDRVTDMQTGQTARETVDIAGCHSLSFVVTSTGREPLYRSGPIQVSGRRLDISVAASIHMTTWRFR